MALTPITGFCGESYKSRALGASAQRSVNLRVEKNEALGSKTPYTLFPRSGKVQLYDLSPAVGYTGAWSSHNRVFVVHFAQLYELLEGGYGSPIGSVAGGPYASMRSNGNQLMVASGGLGYIATGTDFYRPIVSFATGTVDVSGTAVTWLSGDKFLTGNPASDITPGDLMSFDDGTTVITRTVSVVTDDENIILGASAGTINHAFYQAGTQFLDAGTVECIDGYFIVNIPNSRQFRISNLLNGKIWSALDIGEKLGTTDNIAAVWNLSNQLLLIGDNNSTEVWTDSGNADFPFTQVSGRSMSVGTDAIYSVAKLNDGSLCWLMCSDAGRGVIVNTTGGEPVRISDHALEDAIRGYSKISDAIASTYVEDGHSFYRIDFPTPNKTWEFDATSRVWVELGVATGDPDVFNCDLGRLTVQVQWPGSGVRVRLAFDYTSGKVWDVSPDYLDDAGVEIPIMRISPHVNTSLERTTCKAFAIDCSLGVIPAGINGPDGKPLIPLLDMKYSDNGGRTYVDAGNASLGRTGEFEGTVLTDAELFDPTSMSQTNPQLFNTRPYWSGLGSFWIAKTFKLTSTAKLVRAIYAGLVELAP